MTRLATNEHVPRPRRVSSSSRARDGLEVPSAYGRYWLVERLGQGGMAEVYRAHEGEGRSLVVKRLRSEHQRSESARRLFEQEAHLAASIVHENIVRVFGLEALPGGEVFMTMEHVDGSDLRWLLNMARRRGRRLPVWLSVHIATEVLAALDYLGSLTGPDAEHRNVVHCDVTPENIFVSSDGEVKLGDFGVAVEDARPEDFHLGQLRGKLPYCSPEQARGERLDPRSDVYAVAVVLWECLTGRPLVSAFDRERALRAILSPDRPRPSGLNGEVPGALDELVLAALAPDRARRTPSARVLRKRLLELLARSKGTVRSDDVVRGMGQVLAPRLRARAPHAMGATGASSRAEAEERLLVGVPTPPPPKAAPTLSLPGDDMAFPTYMHRQGQTYGPTALFEAIGRLAERAHVDLEAWGLSVGGPRVASAVDLLGLLGIDMGAAARAGPAAFEVSLAQQSLASLFGQLSHAHSSGTLVVGRLDTDGRDERHLRIAEGALVDVWSSVSTLRLWAALTRPQHRGAEGFAAALHRAIAAERPVGELLGEDLQVNLHEAQRFEVHRQLEELFSWAGGVARFVPAELLAPSSAPTLASFVPELVLQTYDERRLMRHLGPHLDHRVLPTPSFTAEIDGLGLLDAERDAVRAALTAGSLDAALMSMPEPSRTVAAATIYSLHAIGLLRFV